MAVYQALTLRLNPLKMDQIRKKNYIRSKDNQPKYEGGVDKEKRPLSLSFCSSWHEIQIFLHLCTIEFCSLTGTFIRLSLATWKYEFNLIDKWWLKGTQYTQ